MFQSFDAKSGLSLAIPIGSRPSKGQRKSSESWRGGEERRVEESVFLQSPRQEGNPHAVCVAMADGQNLDVGGVENPPAPAAF